MLSVEEALSRITAAFEPLPAETVALSEALGRVLARDLPARVTQPPADVSAMDGYAVRAVDVAAVPARLRVVGHVPAGTAHERALEPGTAVRIFTGAPLPAGADAIVIQENTRAEGDVVVVEAATESGRYVRKAGLDFRAGEVGMVAGTRLGPRHIGFAAALNHPWLSVRRRPRVAILATGDEVVLPGDPLGPQQIVSSNGFSLCAMVAACGGVPLHLGIASDDRASLDAMLAAARGADLLVTSGGVSVGEHDLIGQAAGERGFALDFWKIAMRPGKPLLFGRLGETPLLGLPGNPVSTLVCALLFLRPAIDRMLGCAARSGPLPTARLQADLGANDERQDYLRARLFRDVHGWLTVAPFERQDSSMLATLVRADCLVVRPPHAPAAPAGTSVPFLPLSDANTVPSAR